MTTFQWRRNVRYVCRCQNLLTVMTVAPGRQLAMGERAGAMCAVEILLQCRARLTRCRCSIAWEIGGGCTGQMARAKQPPGESGLSASLPPSPQPASLEVLKRGFFVERCASFFRSRSKLFGPSWAKWQAGWLHQRLSGGRPHPPTHKLPQWK